VGLAGGTNTLKINIEHRGNTVGMLNKPATESTSVQGIPEFEELSFSDQNC